MSLFRWDVSCGEVSGKIQPQLFHLINYFIIECCLNSLCSRYLLVKYGYCVCEINFLYA